MSLLSRLISWGSRIAASLLFEEILVEGVRPSAQEAVLYLANHPYHLVDPMIADKVLGRPDVWYVAHSTIYEGLLLGWLYNRFPRESKARKRLVALEESFRLTLLRLLGILRIHREVDGHGDFSSRRENLVLLEEAAEKLAEGHAVVLYPEGGSFGIYGLKQLKAGVGILVEKAIASCRLRGTRLRVLCASTIYGSLDEPFRSRVKVHLDEISGLDKLGRRGARREIITRLDECFRKNLVEIPEEHARAASALAEFLSSDPQVGLRLAAEHIADNRKGESLMQLALERRRLLLMQGVRGEALLKTKRSFVRALLMHLGFLLHLVPSKLLDLLVKHPVKKPHRRGYQVLRSAVVAFLLWYGVVLAVGILKVEAALGLLAASIPLAGIYPHLYIQVNRSTLRWRAPRLYREVVEMEHKLLELLAERSPE